MSIDKLSYAVQLVKAGNKAEALPLLKEIVQDEPDNEAAWLWLHTCVDRKEQKIYCLQQALRINPYNQGAQRALDKLTLPTFAQPQPTTKSAGQKATRGTQQKPARENNPDNSPATKQKSNTTLMVVLILVGLCVLCCVGGWIYLKTAPRSTRTPAPVEFTKLPPSRTPRPTETPEPTLPPDLIITYDNVCLAPSDTEVTIEGYLYFTGSTELRNGEYRIALSKEPEDWVLDHPYEWDAQVFLFIQEGFGPYQMRELPKYRRESDLKIYTESDKVLGHGDPVVITGNMWIHYAADAGGGCGIRVTKVVAQ